MADYPLKGFKYGSDTYTIASSGEFYTVEITGGSEPTNFGPRANPTAITSDKIKYYDPSGAECTIEDLINHRTSPVKLRYTVNAGRVIYSQIMKFETPTSNQGAFIFYLDFLELGNFKSKQNGTISVELGVNITASGGTFRDCNGITDFTNVEFGINLSGTFNTLDAFVQDVITNPGSSYGVSDTWLYKSGLFEELWDNTGKTMLGNIGLKIYLPTPKASLNVVSKWKEGNDFYILINAYYSYTVGSDTHKGLCPILGKLVFNNNARLDHFVFEKLYTDGQ